METTRRTFMKILAGFSLVFSKLGFLFAEEHEAIPAINKKKDKLNVGSNQYFGTEPDGASLIYRASGLTAENNMKKIVELIGGIGQVVGQSDIVILKPNAQWDRQGTTNTDAIKSFIELILKSPGFNGEIIIAENHQYRDYQGRGWTTEYRNGRFNLNELVEHFNNKGYPNVTKYHWRCAGANPDPLEGDDCCGNRVKGPQDGDGYVWRKDIFYKSPNGRTCYMTYPVFTSKYSQITIDLKKGAWKDERYLEDKPVKFINFSGLNHHGHYCGATASVKNLMGVVDMTCGFQGPEPEGAYNVHFIGVSKMVKYIRKSPFGKYTLNKMAYKNFYHAGGALGKFVKSIRFPDLNIITAEWVGWGSRRDVSKSCKPNTILASKDPVSLDYVATRDVLYKNTPAEQETYRQLNDPTNKNGPLWKFLKCCHEQGIGNLDPTRMSIISE